MSHRTRMLLATFVIIMLTMLCLQQINGMRKATAIPDDGFRQQCIDQGGQYWERPGARGCFTNAPFKGQPV